MGSHNRLLSNHTMVAISLVITVLSILILGTQDVRGFFPAPYCGPPGPVCRNRSPVIGRPLPVQFGARGSNRAPYYGGNRAPYYGGNRAPYYGARGRESGMKRTNRMMGYYPGYARNYGRADPWVKRPEGK